MALAGNTGGAGGAKNIARAQRKPRAPKPTPAAAPNFPSKIPVRPGAPTNRFSSGPTTQAQRTHVHVERVKRNRELNRQYVQSKQKAGNPLGNMKAPKRRLQRKKGGGLPEAAIGLASKAAPFLGVAAAPAVAGTLAAVQKATGAKTATTAKKVLENVPKDTAELVSSAPTSTYMLGKTAVTHPKKVPGMVAAPYKELIRHPRKFASEHPVSTLLMVAPAVKAPGLAAGKALRIAGKQTLEGAPKTLPGTALREARPRSRNAVTNALQARREAKSGPRTITPEEIRSRVDYHFENRRKHIQRVEASKTRSIKKQVKQLPKDQRAEFRREQLEGARGGAKTHNDRAFVREFGSTWQVGENGTIVKPKNAGEGHIHSTRADAERIAERLGKTGRGEFTVKQVSDNEFGVVPKVAADQLRQHNVVGTSPSTGARVLRASRTKFTNAVLPLSPKWLTGQAVEGAVRAAVHGAGPTSYLRERRVFKQMERNQPGSGEAFRERALTGGHYGGQLQEFRKQPLHEVFNQGNAEGTLGRQLARLGETSGRVADKPGVKQTLKAWNRYTDIVFDKINGAGIEKHIQRAMLGREIKTKLLDDKLLGLSKKAVAEAAEGLKGTHTQVQMARGVERAYGKYSAFTPSQREFKLHWAPFLPWYKNSVQFLASVLPRDHPAMTALLASGNVATQQERKKLGLSQYGRVPKPGFLQGGIPTKKGGVIRIGHYTPFGIGESRPSESIKGVVLPQFSAAHAALGGLDWKGDKLRSSGEGSRFANALASQVEALVPGAGQAARITGADAALSGKKGAKLQAPTNGALVKEFYPFRSTSAGGSGKKKRKAKKTAPYKARGKNPYGTRGKSPY